MRENDVDALALVGPGGETSWASPAATALLGPLGEIGLPASGGEVEVSGLRLRVEGWPVAGSRLVALTVVGAAGVRARVAALEHAARVVARVGHQIRSPLGGAVAGVELLRAAGLRGESAEIVDMLAAGLEKVEGAARDADLRVSGRALRPTRCRPGDAAAAALRAGLTLAAASEVVLECRGDAAENLAVTVDALALARALAELVENAVEASAAGGRVVVDFARRDRAVVFAVGDAGAGVAAELRDRIGDPWMTTRPGRMGLGLAVAAEIAELHGGFLYLVSPAGPTLFELHIPVEGAEAPAACAACPPGRAAAICWAVVGEEERRATGVWPLGCRRCARFQARVLRRP